MQDSIFGLGYKDSAIFKMNEGLKQAIKEIEQRQIFRSKRIDRHRNTTYGKKYEEKSSYP